MSIGLLFVSLKYGLYVGHLSTKTNGYADRMIELRLKSLLYMAFVASVFYFFPVFC